MFQCILTIVLIKTISVTLIAKIVLQKGKLMKRHNDKETRVCYPN